MDESTSALDTANEEQMYRLLKSENIVFVSVGHRPTLRAYHDRILQLLDHKGSQAANAEGQPANWKILDAATAQLS